MIKFAAPEAGTAVRAPGDGRVVHEYGEGEIHDFTVAEITAGVRMCPAWITVRDGVAYHCTRAHGHELDHAAGTGHGVVASWERAEGGR